MKWTQAWTWEDLLRFFSDGICPVSLNKSKRCSGAANKEKMPMHTLFMALQNKSSKTIQTNTMHT